jgi:hypothetical protein
MIDDPSLSTNRRLDGCLGGEAGPTVLGKKFPLFGSKLILSMQLDPSRFDHSQQTVFYFKVQVIHNFTPWQHFVSNQFVLTIQCIHKSKEGAWHPASTSTAIKGVRIKVRMHVKVCTSALKVRAWVLKVPARVLKAYGSVSEACTWVSKLEGAVAVMCPLHAPDIYTPALSSERRPEMPVAREARDLLPIQSLFRSIDFGPSSLPPFLLILSPTNGVTSSSVEHSLKRRK